MKLLKLLPALGFCSMSFASTPEVVQGYLQIQEALANDTLLGVKESAKKIAEAEKTSKIGKEAAKLSASKDISDARKTFKGLSEAVIADTNKSSRGTAKVAFCPMADAKWLQKGNELRNPYYGASMLECGEFQK